MRPCSVSVRETKPNLSRLLQKAERGEVVTISRGSTPIARLVPVQRQTRDRQPGSLKGILQVGPEFFAPLPDDELAGWQ